MGLKPDRYEADTDVSFFMNVVATRGGVVSHVTTAGSGAAMDQSAALVAYNAEASGSFAVGVLLNDVVNIDQTRQHINQHKDEVQLGGKVAIMRRGVVVTDQILDTPSMGDRAYLAESGNLRAAQGKNECPLVGRFLSIKDENGWAKVAISIDDSPPPPLTVAQ